MKTKLIYSFTLLFFFMSCSKTEEIEEVRDASSIVKSGSNLNIPKGLNYDHNERLQNLIDMVKNDGCGSDSVTVNQFLQNEFSSEYKMLADDTYLEIYQNSAYLKFAIRVLRQRIYFDEHPDLSGYPTIVVDFVNQAYKNTPPLMREIVRDNYFAMEAGEINSSNYVQELNVDCDFLLSELDSQYHFQVEVYRSIAIESYHFWSNKSDGGKGAFDDYYECLQFDESEWNLDSSKMNDNDWPNEATLPKWVDNDIIGGFAAAATSFNLYAALIGATAGSLMT